MTSSGSQSKVCLSPTKTVGLSVVAQKNVLLCSQSSLSAFEVTTPNNASVPAEMTVACTGRSYSRQPVSTTHEQQTTKYGSRNISLL